MKTFQISRMSGYKLKYLVQGVPKLGDASTSQGRCDINIDIVLIHTSTNIVYMLIKIIVLFIQEKRK